MYGFPTELVVTLATASATVVGAFGALAGTVWQLRQARNAEKLRATIEARILSDNGNSRLEEQSPEEHPSLNDRGELQVTTRTDEKLLREYHAQGLTQSRVSFWFSIIFACVGFSIIGFGAIAALNGSITFEKSIIPIISGGVIDGVSGLFFVQSNRARQLMSEFFDKLRADNKLTEALRLSASIRDEKVSSSLKAYLAMHFAGIDVDVDGFRSVVGLPVQLARPSASAKKPSRHGPQQSSAEG